MTMRALGFAGLLLAVLVLAVVADATAGTKWRITSKEGDKEATYDVNFGGGKAFGRYTAFDPDTKKFVYLDWEDRANPPKPAAVIYDHRTGETVPLYKFPGAANPLPRIPSIDELKVCPYTGDKNFQKKRIGNYD
jgi:hypothetical protein